MTHKEDHHWKAFLNTYPESRWEDIEKQAQQALSSTNSSRPFLSQREKRKVQFDPIPYLIDHEEWQNVKNGLQQRTQLLNMVLKDLYGPQDILKRGLVDIKELYSLKNYTLASHGSTGMSLPKLHLFHCKLEKTSLGFQVTEDITSTPRQLGLILEHRLIQNRIFGDLQKDLKLKRIASWFEKFRQHLFTSSQSPLRQTFGVVLSQGIDGDGYDEHAYLSHYLGLPIVQAEDLVVRNKMVYLKNLGELQRVNFIMRRVPEKGLDPLEMEDSSPFGIPGLMDCLREQNVFMDALPGAGILEKRVLFHAMPSLCQHFLQQNLIIPQSSSPEGEKTDLYPGIKDGEISSRPQQLFITISNFNPSSQNTSSHHPQNHEQNTKILPGGLALSQEADSPLPLVKDIWICGAQKIDWPQNNSPNIAAPSQVRNIGLPSRVADATLWFGRYMERSDALCRILREILLIPSLEHDISDAENISSYLELIHGALEIDDSQVQDLNWEEHWNQICTNPQMVGSLHFNLLSIQRNAYILQDRISVDMLNLTEGLTSPFLYSPIHHGRREAALTQTIEHLSAITGLSIDSMTHCDEWHFLLLGRRLERAWTTLALLKALYANKETYGENAWELILRTFDSIMTYRWRYHLQFKPSSILSMMIHDETNPRSITFQVNDMMDTLKSMVGKGSLWAIEPSIHLRKVNKVIEALNYDEPNDNFEKFNDGMDQISKELMNFYNDITKTLLHL
jgi:uncharacterized alpha-E superfamily protein